VGKSSSRFSTDVLECERQMKVTEITVSLGRTVNLGNYENVKLEVSMTAECEPNEPANKCFDELYQQVRSNLYAKLENCVK
jgi:hypothetical protein